MRLLVLSALLFSLLFPPVNASWLAYLFAIPLLLHLKSLESPVIGFRNGVLFGLITMGVFHAWIFALHPWSTWLGAVGMWLMLSVYLSLFYGFSFGLFVAVKRQMPHIIAFPTCWILGEWLRSLGPIGDPAGAIGYSQANSLMVLQSASLLGVFGISFLCLVVNTQVFCLFTSLWAQFKTSISYLLAIAASVTFYAIIWLGHQSPTLSTTPIAVVQGNHAQSLKLNSLNWAKLKQDYLSLTANVTPKSIVFWPETIIPTQLLNDTPFLKRLQNIAQERDLSIVFGSPSQEAGRYYNSVLAMTPKGLDSQRYHKEKLMPFGEYVPFRNAFKKIPTFSKILDTEDYSAGTNPKLMDIRSHAMGTAICLESIYPAVCRNRTKQGADFLFVAVNNAWFAKSSAAEKHLQMSILRAVENNRYLVQAANTGLSAIVDAHGKVLRQSTLGQTTVLSGVLKTGYGHSPYFHIGNAIIGLAWILVIWALIRIQQQNLGQILIDRQLQHSWSSHSESIDSETE